MNEQKLFFKEPVFREQGINCPQKFGRGGNNSLGIRFALCSFLEVIIPEIRRFPLDTACHNKSNSPGMNISPFGYSEFSFMLTRLFNNRIQATEADKLPLICESPYVNYFSHKINSGFSANSRNRGKYLYFPLKAGLGCFIYNLRDFLFFLFKLAEFLYLKFKHFLIEGIREGDGILGKFIDSLKVRFFFFSKYFNEVSVMGFPYGICGGEVLKQMKQVLFKYGKVPFQFREEQAQEPFYLGLCPCDLMGNAFLFPYQIAQGISGIFEMIFAFKFLILIKLEELSNSFSRLSIGCSWFRVNKSEKAPHPIRVDFNNIIALKAKEIKEVFVVNAGGFHAYKELGFKLGDEGIQSREAFGAHLQGSVSDGEGAIFKGEGEVILGDIDTQKVRVLHNCTTSFEVNGGQAAPKLNLPLKLSLRSSINLFEPQGAGDTLLSEPKCSGGMVSCPPGLNFINSWYMGSISCYLNYQNLN